MNIDQLPTIIDLGDGRTLRFYSHGDSDAAVAFEETHPSATDTKRASKGGECMGAGYLDVPECPPSVVDSQKWTVESWEPLTLSPSILCRLCGNHGFVRQGKWVSA